MIRNVYNYQAGYVLLENVSRINVSYSTESWKSYPRRPSNVSWYLMASLNLSTRQACFSSDPTMAKKKYEIFSFLQRNLSNILVISSRKVDTFITNRYFYCHLQNKRDVRIFGIIS